MTEIYCNRWSLTHTTDIPAAYVLALAAWHRDDLHDAVRWLGGDIGLFATPIAPQALDHVILRAGVASAAGDAGCRACVLRAIDTLHTVKTRVHNAFAKLGIGSRAQLARMMR
jgi:hypothetical protein